MNGAGDVQQQCIFCQIISGAVPSKVVYEDKHTFAILDINPANPGHLLVITKEHYAIMPQIPDEVIGHLGQVSKALSQALIKGLKAEGTNVFITNGVAGGQRAQHFMLHVIPRKQGDGLTVFDVPQRTQTPEEKDQIIQRISPIIENVLGYKPGEVIAEIVSEEKADVDVAKDVDKDSDVEVDTSDESSDEDTVDENESDDDTEDDNNDEDENGEDDSMDTSSLPEPRERSNLDSLTEFLTK